MEEVRAPKRDQISVVSFAGNLGNRDQGAMRVDSLPFSPGDITAGTENELQAIVTGRRSTVDLPVSIERSKYYTNIIRRVMQDEAPLQLVRELNRYLEDNRDQVWENSWVPSRAHKSHSDSDCLGARGL